MVVKLDHGVSGEGNAIVELRGLGRTGTRAELLKIAERVDAMRLQAVNVSLYDYFDRLERGGGVVEERIVARELRSPSVQLELEPEGARVVSTHDQILEDHRCVELTFKGEVRGHYCLKRMSANCVEPFTVTVESASISGANSEAYCGINENQTTCEAVDDTIHSKQCDEANDCGIQMGDGLCERVSGQPNRCTYGCGVAAQCPTGLSCGSDEHHCL